MKEIRNRLCEVYPVLFEMFSWPFFSLYCHFLVLNQNIPITIGSFLDLLYATSSGLSGSS